MGKKQATDPNTLILKIVAEISPLSATDVRPDSELVAELGFDSLGLLELLVAVEDALKLPPVDIEALGRLDRVVDLQRVAREAQDRMANRRPNDAA